ncbi:MAG TPA: efflux RND transporter periplasmic adaptor subunit [Candidatus Acidoferrum sp.]|nr:efflux RND transporter periplasmic adaptor subunit [Candidatus Acidoferrum sp.]
MKVKAPVLLMVSAAIGMGLTSCAGRGGLQAAERNIPVAAVNQVNLQLEVNTTGELRANQMMPAMAPPVAGATLQIVQLAKSGNPVKKGDIVVAFDPSEQEYNLAQASSDASEAQQEMIKANDDAAVQTAEDRTNLLKDKFAVRQAELDVSKNPLLSAIDAQKNLLTLAEAKRALAQLEQDIQSHGASNQASIDVAQEKEKKAQLAIAEAQRNIQSMRVRSPIDGLVFVRENQNASGGMYWGQALPPFQEGDQVYPGMIVAQVIDLGKMEIDAKVKESERATVKPGQTADVRVDALPGAVLRAKVESVAGMVSNMWFDDASHNFDVTLALTKPDPRLRPGFSAHVVIYGDHLNQALSIPQQAIFNMESKPEVYVEKSDGFQPTPVKIRYLTEGTAIAEGLKLGTKVALVNPEENNASNKQAAPGGVGLR